MMEFAWVITIALLAVTIAIILWVFNARRGTKARRTSRSLYKNVKLYDPEEVATIVTLESPKRVSECGEDSVRIWAANDLGFVCSCRIGRLPDRSCNAWLRVRHPDGRWLHGLASPDGNFVDVDNSSGWYASGISLTCMEDAKTWRLKFVGNMKLSHNEHFEETTCVNVSLFLTFRARNNMCRLALVENSDLCDMVDQWGTVDGEFTINDEAMNVRALAHKERRFGRPLKNAVDSFNFIASDKLGNSFRAARVKFIDGTSKSDAYSVMPYGDVFDLQISDAALLEHLGVSDSGMLRMRTKFQMFEVKYTVIAGFETMLDTDWTRTAKEVIIQMSLSGSKTYGSCLKIVKCDATRNHVDMIATDNPNQCMKTLESRNCVSLEDNSCLDYSIVGGKGAQLGALCRMKLLNMKSRVPNGFVITVNAFDAHLWSSSELKKAIQKLSSIACGEIVGDIEVECGILNDIICNMTVSDALTRDIHQNCIDVFGCDFDSQYLAIRSSAVEEDSIEASCAGQMETFLDVTGLTGICAHVKKCWASLYSFQAVEYRRMRGLAVVSRLAVVVQKTINPDSAGVVFTTNPTNANCNQMVINSNFGLGETVVSGECEPDKFVIANMLGKLEILERLPGSKRTSAKLNGDGYCIMTSDVDVSNTAISDEQVIQLCNMALMIEKWFGSPRDIEWAIHDGDIYILQARPITTIHMETTEQLIHEFDSTVANDRVCLSTANVQEMMPSAVSPLTLSVFGMAIDASMQHGFYQAGIIQDIQRTFNAVVSCANQLFICVSLLSIHSKLRCVTGDTRVPDVVLVGKPIEEKLLTDEKAYLGQPGYFERLVATAKLLWYSSRIKHAVVAWENLLHDGYHIKAQDTFANQIRTIDSNLNLYYVCWCDTVRNSSSSGRYTLIVLSMLAPIERWDSNLFSKVPLILESCGNVFSAKVPATLNRIALEVSRMKQTDFFTSASNSKATEWLLSERSAEAGEIFRNFMKMHGHRCVREAEFREIPWKYAPEKIVEPLQAILKQQTFQVDRGSSAHTAEDTFNSLQVSCNRFKKAIFISLIKKAREAVASREWGKSISIRMVDVFRVAYQRCGELMRAEGLIPDADLVFFFTHAELMKLSARRSPSLVTKAMRRRRVLIEQSKAVFDEVVFGQPVAMSSTTVADNLATTLRSVGFPVGQGVTVGTCRVVSSLAEAKGIVSGEILIVPYTDVGWSPYFPLITGLVTEKGGFISHGAVVAREYGLPCVVGCANATNIFRTGQTVRVDGNAGTVCVVEDEES